MNSKDDLVNKFKNQLMFDGVDATFFSPASVNKYRDILNINDTHILSEVSYTLQYIEYMCFEFKCVRFHIVVQNIKIKNFVIACVSVIEAMLYDYVKSKGYNDNFVEWEDLKSFVSNEYMGLDKSENVLDDKKIRVVSKLQIKLSEDERKEKNISFNSLIDMVSNSSNKKYYLHGIGITT